MLNVKWLGRRLAGADTCVTEDRVCVPRRHRPTFVYNFSLLVKDTFGLLLFLVFGLHGVVTDVNSI